MVTAFTDDVGAIGERFLWTFTLEPIILVDALCVVETRLTIVGRKTFVYICSAHISIVNMNIYSVCSPQRKIIDASYSSAPSIPHTDLAQHVLLELVTIKIF